MRPILILAMLALAGCAAPVEDAPEPMTEEMPEPTPEPSELVLTLDPIPIGTQGSVTVAGSVSAPAQLTVQVVEENGRPASGAPVAIEASGAWNTTQEVGLGHTTFLVTATDGVQSVNQSLLAVRLYEASIAVVFRGDADLVSDRDETVLLDMGTLTSAPLYDGCDTQHPGEFVVHDALLQWQEQSDVAIEYSACGQFGFGINAIDDHESPGFWCYEVDGEAAEFGISLQPMGARMLWDDCALVLG